MLHKYFNKGIQTLDEAKQAFKKLCKQLHPDVGGDAQSFIEMKKEFEQLIKNLESGATQETAWQYDRFDFGEFTDIIEKLVNLDGLYIEIVGAWIWCSGNTKEHKEVLKSMGFKWSMKKCAWYLANEGYRKKSRKVFSMDEIRDLYGSHGIHANGYQKLAATNQ